MKNVVQKVIAGCALIHDGKVLILQRAADEENLPNIWELPSGKKEPLEPVEDAAKREFEEETGLDINVGEPLGVFNFGWEKEDEIRDATEIVFSASLENAPNVKISSEHQNFAWITEEEIDNYNISEETKEIIRKSFS
jgi:8-oxo-dGTP diphosphatase